MISNAQTPRRRQILRLAKTLRNIPAGQNGHCSLLVYQQTDQWIKLWKTG
jgi:hypothetical protein